MQYQLLNLPGKGATSEVWKAYDLETSKYFALKICDPWEGQKQSTTSVEDSASAEDEILTKYIRESEMQKTFDHPRIILVFDLFLINQHAFGMECSSGEDLETNLEAVWSLGGDGSTGVDDPNIVCFGYPHTGEARHLL